MHTTEQAVRPLRRGLTWRLALAALVAGVLGVMTVVPAHAAAYRFWGFYQLTDGAWAFAQKGADQTVPTDGAVEGWRFAVSDTSGARFPRATPAFEQICGSTPAQADNKRVAVLVDFGRSADTEDDTEPPAPKAHCAVVAQDATSMDVLETVGELRVENNLVCGVAGFPASGCGGEVGQLTPEMQAADESIDLAALLAPTAPTGASGFTGTATATDGSATPAPVAADQPTTQEASSGTSTAAYVIAGLALLALVVFIVARARGAAARRGS